MLEPETVFAILENIKNRLDYGLIRIFREAGPFHDVGIFFYFVNAHLDSFPNDLSLHDFDFEKSLMHVKNVHTYSDIIKKAFEEINLSKSKSVNQWKEKLRKKIIKQLSQLNYEATNQPDFTNLPKPMNLINHFDKIFSINNEFRNVLESLFAIGRKISMTEGNQMDASAVASMLSPSLFNSLYGKQAILKYKLEFMPLFYDVFKQIALTRITPSSSDLLLLSPANSNTSSSSEISDNCYLMRQPFMSFSSKSLLDFSNNGVIIELVRNGNIELIEKFLKDDEGSQPEPHKRRLNTIKGICDRSLLHLAIVHDQEQIACLLISKNANTLAQDRAKRTPLHYAIDKQQFGVISAIQAHEASLGISSITLADKRGETPKTLVLSTAPSRYSK